MNKLMHSHFLYKLTSFAVLLAFIVIILGAYTRLTHAGLGCPDWPGCYGHFVVPQQEHATVVFPDKPLETRKAWTEMVHRYAAGSLGLIILSLGIYFFAQRQVKKQQKWLVSGLMLLVIFQALLGMWTVTLQLLPLVVMGHLLGGFAILTGLWWLRLSLRAPVPTTFLPFAQRCMPWVILGILIVLMQIILGGWVSANYAGLACVGFPSCNGQWLPRLNMTAAFNIFSPIGINYEGGALDSTARVTIQMVHRCGAVITLIYLYVLTGWLIFKSQHRMICKQSLIILLLVSVQFTLGIINVIKFLPLPVAVAHNGVAALLLLSLVTLLYYFLNLSDKAYKEGPAID